MLVEGAHGGISSSYLATLYITVLKSSCLFFFMSCLWLRWFIFYIHVCVCFDILLVFHTRTIRKRCWQILYADTNTESIIFLISKKNMQIQHEIYLTSWENDKVMQRLYLRESSAISRIFFHMPFFASLCNKSHAFVCTYCCISI